MSTQSRAFPPIPQLGRPESVYAKLARDTQASGDTHGHEAAKVCQYIELAADENLPWEEKIKYYRHAPPRHCQPPSFPDEETAAYYQSLAELLKTQAGQEALKAASNEDDMYAARLAMGQSREQIEDEAEAFFKKIMGQADECPEWIGGTDWMQLKLLRDQWL